MVIVDGQFDRAEIDKWRTNVPIDTINASATRLRNAGKPREAIALLRAALDREPNSYKGWDCLGACYFDLGNFDSAIACAEVSDGLNPNSAATHDNLGMAHYSLGQLEAARKHWAKSVDIDSTRTSALMGLCRIYETRGLRDEYVETIFRIAARADAPLAHLRAAVQLYSQLRQPAKAAETLRRAIGQGLDSASVRELVERYPKLQELL